MRLSIAVVVIACLLIAGCGGGNKLVGKWQETKSGLMTMEFTQDGKLTVSGLGISVPAVDYKVDGNKLTISEGSGTRTEVFSVSGDILTLGEGPNAVTFKQVK